MSKGRIVIISGPSGSGKTTLSQKILKSSKFKGKLVESISATTRAKRPGERHKKDYLFISRKMFEYKIAAGHFLEYEKFFGNYYGTLKKTVRELLASGKHVLLCIDVNGARSVGRMYPQAVKVFIKTPTVKDLEKRLVSRGSEKNQGLKIRLARAKKELKAAKKFQHVVVNGSLAVAYRRLEKVLAKELSLG